MRKRLLALFLILVFICSGITGCTKKEINGQPANATPAKDNQSEGDNSKEDNSKEAEKEIGRYMESTVSLPDLSENETVIRIIQNAKKQIELYTKVKGKFYCYQLSEDLSWKKSSADWLNNGKLSGSNVEISDLSCGEDGNYYIGYVDYDAKPYCHILKSEDNGKTSQELNIPYLKKYKKTDDNYKLYPMIRKINVLHNENLVIYEVLSNSLMIFSQKGKELDRVPVKTWEDTGDASFLTSDNNIVTASQDNKGILIYDTTEKETANTLNYEYGKRSMAFAGKAEDTLYIGDSNGIHRLAKGGTLWETVVDGALNSMSRPSLTFDKLFVIPGKDEQYFASYQSTDGGYQLMHYVFNKKIAAVPSHEITVYSLQENNTIRQAVSLFQSKNTDVKVNYVVAMGEEGGTVTDYIRALNTELLAHNGADVLVLDGLPVDSYIEKGVLADISDILQPMKASGELLSNITDCYSKDGKIYQMPTRFSFPAIIGDDAAVSSMKDIQGILSYINQNKGKTFTSSITYRALLQDYLSLYSQSLYDNGVLNKTKLAEFIRNLKVIADNIKATENGNENSQSLRLQEGFITKDFLFSQPIMGLLSKEYSTGMLQINDIYSTLIPFVLAKKCNMKCTTINRLFIPKGAVGLNSASKEADTAKQFIQSLFMEEVQNTDFYDGFPINSKSLSSWIAREEKSSFGTSDDKGNHIEADWPKRKEREKILDMIKGLTTPIEINQVTDNIIINETLPFFTGDIDAEQAANAADTKISTYLAE